MSEPLAQLMTEVDDLRNKVTDIHSCLMQIKNDLEQKREYPSEHSKFVDEWIQRSKRRRAVLDKIVAQVGGWAIIVILGAIGVAVWSYTVGLITHK